MKDNTDLNVGLGDPWDSKPGDSQTHTRTQLGANWTGQHSLGWVF